MSKWLKFKNVILRHKVIEQYWDIETNLDMQQKVLLKVLHICLLVLIGR